MKKNNNQSTERKWKRSLIYSSWRKRIEEELTYEKFVENIDNEFSFRYKNITLDIAFHYEGKKKVYELNLNGYEENATHGYFNSADELLKNARIEGKSIKEIWNELEN